MTLPRLGAHLELDSWIAACGAVRNSRGEAIVAVDPQNGVTLYVTSARRSASLFSSGDVAG